MIIGSEIWAGRDVLVAVGRRLPEPGAQRSYCGSGATDSVAQKLDLEDDRLRIKKSPDRATGRETSSNCEFISAWRLKLPIEKPGPLHCESQRV